MLPTTVDECEESFTSPLKKATVLLLLQENQVLLAMKKRGFGVGKWNGVGGKPDPGEEIIDTAVREAREEIGVEPVNPQKVALFKYYFPHDNFGMQVWVFTATTWKGEPAESEEMNPKWFNFEDIPYAEMWSDDEVWIPKVLSGKLLNGSFVFDDHGKILDYKMNEVNSVQQVLKPSHQASTYFRPPKTI